MNAGYGRGLGWALGLVCVLAVGCIGPRNYENENDHLRAQRLKQQRLIKDLRQTLARRSQQVEALEQQVHGAKSIDGVRSPSMTAIEFGRYSGVVDTDEDGRDDLIRLYVKPVDQQGRLMPVAGLAKLQAALIEPGSNPQLIAEKQYSPKAFDQTYRSTLFGNHYTLELPLGEELPTGQTDLTVKLSFTNATGAIYSRQMAVTVTR